MKEGSETFTWLIIKKGGSQGTNRHVRIDDFGLLDQEFIASLLPKRKQPDIVGEEGLCADLESHRTV